MRALSTGFALLLALLGLFHVPARAAVSAADAQAMQTVVRAQLAAFAADDAQRAFSYATASIQTMFGTPDNFIDMVRTTYPVVYRPVKVAFLKPATDAGRFLQPVHMTDGRGGAWIAVYSMQRQPDKSWRIAGCVLVPDSGQST